MTLLSRRKHKSQDTYREAPPNARILGRRATTLRSGALGRFVALMLPLAAYSIGDGAGAVAGMLVATSFVLRSGARSGKP